MALHQAKKDLVPVDVSPDGALFHDVIGKHNNTLVLLRSGICCVCAGFCVIKSKLLVGKNHRNGIKACRIVKGVCEVIGIKHVVSKVLTRGKNPYSIVNVSFSDFIFACMYDEFSQGNIQWSR